MFLSISHIICNYVRKYICTHSSNISEHNINNILHKLQSVLTGMTMRGSLSMFSKVLTTSTEKLFLQKQKKVHRLYLKNKSTFIAVIFTTHILYKHTGSKVGKKAVQDRWMMPAFWIQGNKKLDCWTNKLNCLNAPIYRKKSTGKGVVREGVEHFQQVKPNEI